ncbi:MAG: glycosyltransferase family 39 protein [Armatimonadetes bacterium]|nr:glycosyltransferase family 39 protein [Armatimonadota bacterium]
MRWLLWLCVLAALIDLRAFGLTDLDEGFYASVAWEMRHSGDWRTPTFLGEPWFEKPPLLYWLMVGSMRVFGENEFALRLPSALMYALTIVLLAWWGNRRLGQGAGSWAALLFALAPLSLILARLAITDMALAFFLTVAVIALWEARGLGWSLIGGVALGLAFLTKGPFGLGLVGLLYVWNAQMLHARGLRFRWALFALGVALLTALPWYVGVYLQHGAAFFNEFVVKQNLLRFAGGDTAHSVLPLIQRGDVGSVLAGVAVYLLFYVVVLWLGGLSMAGGVSVLWAREDDPLRLYLRRWAWLVFGLFTLSFTKLPAYIFPMFPALALLVGARMAQGRVLYTPTPALPAGGEGAESPPPFTGEVGRGAKSRAPTRRLLTVASLARSAGTLATVLGAAVWTGVALYRPLWEGAPWGIALALGMPLAMLAMNRPVAPPWMRGVGALALLIGWNGALTGYDRLALRPVRELALKPPPYRTLLLYRVNPGYPSLQFYRRGAYMPVGDPATAQAQMTQTGAYCLTTDPDFGGESAIRIGQAQAMGRAFYLFAPKYTQSQQKPP